MAQMTKVSTRYGAPMGRPSSPSLNDEPRTVRLFRVRLDRGGYDDGGAYWGHGAPIWCAMDNEGSMQTVRAGSREAAALSLYIHPKALKMPLARAQSYGFAVLDGRAPMPPDTKREHVIQWLSDAGVAMGNLYTQGGA